MTRTDNPMGSPVRARISDRAIVTLLPVRYGPTTLAAAGPDYTARRACTSLISLNAMPGARSRV